MVECDSSKEKTYENMSILLNCCLYIRLTLTFLDLRNFPKIPIFYQVSENVKKIVKIST